MSTDTPKLSVSSTEVRWEQVKSDTVCPQIVTVGNAGEGALDWKVAACPWWLEGRRDEDKLVLRVRNCGKYRGTVRLKSNNGEQAVKVTAHVTPSFVTSLFGGLRGAVGGGLGFAGAAGWFTSINKTTHGDFFRSFPLWVVPISSLAIVWGLCVGGKRLALDSGVGAALGAAVGLCIGTESQVAGFAIGLLIAIGIAVSPSMILRGLVASALGFILVALISLAVVFVLPVNPHAALPEGVARIETRLFMSTALWSLGVMVGLGALVAPCRSRK